MTLRLNLGNYLQQHGITAYRLVKEVEGRVAPNTVYSLARRPAQRIDLKTVGVLMKALEGLTGEKVEFSEMLEDKPSTLNHLQASAETPVYDPSKAKKFRYSGKAVTIEGGPTVEQIIAEGRGRQLP
ncbi:hypothetical protein [Deinococcus marmoris]|uniref:HTH cro/C1-type domain-containing protein n=1 Tax=Deinococcus marmoris TaxID=249408 RepID=A0A1U7NVA8_9DEIO|nr:hypothetical protein [Deinococcus marmoris]OLV16840.1 hypothetical protein BOO71_0010729 [Deinococcus marmoris]